MDAAGGDGVTVTELESPKPPKEVDHASVKALHRAWLLNLEQAYEAEVVKALRRALRTASAQLGNLTAQGEPGEPYVSMDDLQALVAAWGEEVAENLLPKITDVMLAGAQGTGLAIAGSAGIAAEAIESPALQYLSAANNRLTGIGDDAWNAVRTQLVEGMQAGEGIPDLKRRVRESLGVVESRARMIARTEVIGASNAGAYFQAKAAKAEVKIWLSTDDARTRPTHSSIDGQKVGIDELFVVGGAMMRYPHDPAGPPGETINCRCTTLYDEESLCVCTPSWVTKAEGALVAAGEPDCACSTQHMEADTEAMHAESDRVREAGFRELEYLRPSEMSPERARKLRARKRYYKENPDLQQALREAGGATMPPGTLPLTAAEKRKALKLADDLDGAFDEFGVQSDQPMAVYRGVSGSFADDIRRLRPGDRIADDGYVATTTNTVTSGEFGEGGAGMEIIVPPGTRMLPGYEPMEELVLPRGINLEYRGTTGDGLLQMVVV